MADISKLSRLIGGIQRQVDLSSNTLVMSSLKLGTSELTKAKLDLLAITVDSATAVDASAQHHHDGRYFTESEIGSTADGAAGAALVGVDQTPAFSNFSGANVQAVLESIDTALGTAGGNTFLDGVFRIQNTATPTKQISFNAAAITAATTRQITMPDADVDLGALANTTLSNLGITAINSDLIPSGSQDLGTTTDRWAAVNGNIVRAYSKYELYSGSSVTLTLDNDLATPAGDTIHGMRTNQDLHNIGMFSSISFTADANPTGDVILESGNKGAGTGNSGGITLQTGTSVGGARGKISLNALEVDVNSSKIVNVTDPTAAQDAATKAYADTKAAAADVSDLITLSGVAANSTNLGTFSGAVIPDSQTVKQALQSLETKTENNASLINNFEWANSALDYVIDNTIVPATEVSGDRYVLSHDGGAPNAAWDGASAGDVVEFNGTIWVATTPTTGTFVSVDDDTSGLYNWGGASWSFKAFEATTASTGLAKSGFDIQLADAAAANGVAVSAGAISVSLAVDPGLEFNTGSLRVKVDVAGAIERVTAGLDVKDSSIDTNRLANSAVTNDKVSATAGILFSKMASLTADKVAVTNGSGVVVAGSANATDITTLTDGSNADSLHKHSALKDDFVAGETLTAGIRAVRFARDAETAGRVYLAEKTPVANDGTDDKFNVIGLFVAAGEIAGAAANNVVKAGSFTATAHGFTIGRPVYLTDGNGGLTSTAPTASGDAVVQVGVVKDVNTIEVQIQVVGVN